MEKEVFCINKCLENVDIYRVKLCKRKLKNRKK